MDRSPRPRPPVSAATLRDPAHPLHRWRNNRPPLWTAAEDQLLRATHGILPLAALAARLPTRSPGAIGVRARKLGLRAYRPDRASGTPAAFPASRVARMLGVNDYTVRRWIASGILPCHRTPFRAGRRPISRIDIEDLTGFLDRYRHLYDPERIVDPSWRRWVRALPPARERWHTPKEVARLLGRSHHTVRSLIRAGDLAAQQICGHYWIGERALRAHAPVVPDGKPTPEAVKERRARTLAAREGAARPYGRRHVTGPIEAAPSFLERGQRPGTPRSG